MRSENLAQLTVQIEQHRESLLPLPDEAMRRPLGPGNWTGVELLGHLSDSAAINRQRIVRSQYERPYLFPTYDQATWVQVQAYGEYGWSDLVTLFVAEYRHLVHVLAHLPEESASDPCPVTFGSSTYVTVDWLIGHVVRHNDHHLRQIYWLAGHGDLPDPRIVEDPIEALP